MYMIVHVTRIISLYTYIYIYIYTSVYNYIYIYIERETIDKHMYI